MTDNLGTGNGRRRWAQWQKRGAQSHFMFREDYATCYMKRTARFSHWKALYRTVWRISIGVHRDAPKSSCNTMDRVLVILVYITSNGTVFQISLTNVLFFQKSDPCHLDTMSCRVARQLKPDFDMTTAPRCRHDMALHNGNLKSESNAICGRDRFKNFSKKHMNNKYVIIQERKEKKSFPA